MRIILRLSVHRTSRRAFLALRQASWKSRRWVRSCGLAAIVALFSTTRIGLENLQFVRRVSDGRAERLGAFFKSFNCPVPHYVEDYLRAADRYGLDYRLLPAISVRETTCGLTEANNNRWGYHPGRQSFPSVRVGIDFVTRQLATKPPYAGKTVKEKLWTYNPRPAYPDEVQRIMRQIE